MIRLPLMLFGIYVALVLEATAFGSGTGLELQWLAAAASLSLWGLKRPLGVLLAGVCGLLLDGLSAGPLGLQMALFALLAWMIGTMRQHQRWSSPALLIVSASLVALSSAFAMEVAGQAGFDWNRNDLRTLGLMLAGPAAATGLVTGALYGAVRSVDFVCGWVLPPLLWRRPVPTD